MKSLTLYARATLTLTVALLAGACAPAEDGTDEANGAAPAGQTDAQQGAEKQPGETVEPSAEAQAVEAIAMARQLAEYGERTQSPMALIASAQILMDTPTQPLEGEPESEANEEQPAGEAPAGAGEKTETAESARIDPSQLLDQAESMAGDNENVRALVEQLRGRAQMAQRGAVGGARQGFYRVNALATNLHRVAFRANEYAIVCIDGDDDTDLDLYVNDENGNLIGSSRGYSDEECVDWTPRWTGEFRIRVTNLGWVYNVYEFATN